MEKAFNNLEELGNWLDAQVDILKKFQFDYELNKTLNDNDIEL